MKSLYVVGNEQSLHFTQFKKVLSKMSYEWADDIQHIPFGLILKAGNLQSYSVDDVNDFEWAIIRALELFPQTVKRAADDLDPSIIAKYAIDLAQSFSSFYGNVKVLSDPTHLPYRIALITSTAIVLKEALRLLGMKAPEEM